MTRDNDFKKLVRERMAKTGEAYTTARRQLEAKTAEAPSLRGWFVTGPGDDDPAFRLTDYEGGLDPAMRHEGRPCAFVRSTVPSPGSHAVVMQSISSARWVGKRVRFAAWVKAAPGTTEGALWMRVVPPGRASSYAHGLFVATAEWQRGEVVLDVDPRSSSIMFGLSLSSAGAVWMSGATFEAVDKAVAVTTLTREPPEPVNLSFVE